MLETIDGTVSVIASMSVYLWILVLAGVLLGLLVGILPGLSFVIGVLLLVPFTFAMDTTPALMIMVAAYVSGTYGGAITSILINVPGEPNTVPLLWDGYAMTRQGKAAEALGWAAMAALIGGFVAWLLMVFASEPFASVALNLGQPEYFAIVLLGLASILALSETSMTVGLIAMLGGMLVATVGVDPISGAVRYSFGSDILLGGIDFIVVMVGAYALSEAIERVGQSRERPTDQRPDSIPTGATTHIPGLRALRERAGSFGRGMFAGGLLGAVPGAGATVAAFVAYGLEKQFGRFRRDVGSGSPNGIIGPQAAGTATVGGALIPLLVLGIPGSAAAAVILGVFLLHNVQPGPQIFVQQPELMYSIFAAYLLSLAFMFAIGVFGVRLFVRVLRVPAAYVAAFVAVLSFIGVFTLRQAMADVWLMLAFGLIGYFMQRKNYPIAALVLGVILGPLAERFFRTAMIAHSNDWTVFFTRPISGTLMGVFILLVLFLSYRAFRERRLRLVESEEEREQSIRGERYYD